GVSPSEKVPHTGIRNWSRELHRIGGEDAVQYDHGRGGVEIVRLDRQPASAITKRAQVRGILEHLIETELNPGDAIPSERALVVRLAVSRVTVRQAIADLVAAGVLERVH